MIKNRLLAGWVAALACAAAVLFAPLASAVEKRPLPDYDGRDTGTTPGRALLWVPRVALFPAYVVSEYVIRRPLGFVITAAEKAEVPAKLYNFFAFGPNHSAGIVPIAFIDFGFDPSVGLYAFWDDVGFKGHDLRLRGSTWGPDWLSGTATERFHFSDDFNLTLSGTGIHRPDFAFYGLGPESLDSHRSRYGATTVDARAVAEFHFPGASFVDAGLGYRGASFRKGDYGDDPTIEESVAAGAFAAPPGYAHGYRAVVSSLRLVLDSRKRLGGSNSGGRLELVGEPGVDLSDAPTSSWLRYGGTLGGFVDLGDSGRVLGLSVSALLADPLGSGEIPFSEQVALGGSVLMPAFRPGRLFDRSGLVTSLRYSWPIWMWLNGSLQAAVGNVFGEHFDGASVEDSRFSGAVGIESSGSRDSIFQLLFGVGTETFEQGGKIDSVRLVFGARSGF